MEVTMATLYFIQEGVWVIVYVRSDVTVRSWQGSVILPKIGMGHIAINTAYSIADQWAVEPQHQGDALIFKAETQTGFSGENELFRFSLPQGSYPVWFSPDTTMFSDAWYKIPVETRFPHFPLTVNVSRQMVEDVIPDTTAPEPFNLSASFQGKFFNSQPSVIFYAKDLQSGVSHYEARETTDNGLLDWHAVQSPYILPADAQSIEIKAVDYFGNERVESLTLRTHSLLTLSLVSVLLAGTALFFVLQKLFRTRKRS